MNDLEYFQANMPPWWRGRPDDLTVQIVEVTAGPARRIVDAMHALPAHVSGQVWWSLASSRSTTLASIGNAIIGQDDPLAALTISLYFDVFLFDLQAVYPRLSNQRVPWCAIRGALADVDAGWHGTNGGRLSAYDRAVLREQRAQGKP